MLNININHYIHSFVQRLNNLYRGIAYRYMPQNNSSVEKKNKGFSSVNIEQPDIILDGCIPIINGKGNKIIIWENGVSKELSVGMRIKEFSEIIMDGNDNILELYMPIVGRNNKLHMRGDRHYCKIEPTFKFWDNLIDLLTWDTHIIIGQNTSLRNSIVTSSDNASIEIGKECMIAAATIHQTDFHSIIDLDTGKVTNIPYRTLHIGDRVWLAEQCLILKNSFIPNGCIVAARAVVCKKFEEDNCIIAGNPAQIVKKRVTWDRTGAIFYEKNGPWVYQNYSSVNRE